MNRETIWNFWAAHYEGLWVQKTSLAPTREKILMVLRGMIEKGKPYRIIDVGCGTGELLGEIAQAFPEADYDLELFGIDFSEKMIEKAKEKTGSIHYEKRNAKDITSLGQAFDIIICSHSFPYYEDQGAVLKSFQECLTPQGSLLLAQASENNLYDRVAMFFVKLTVGRAHYPSIKAIKAMIQGLFQVLDVIKIKKGVLMPSIYFFVCKVEKAKEEAMEEAMEEAKEEAKTERGEKGENHEYFID